MVRWSGSAVVRWWGGIFEIFGIFGLFEIFEIFGIFEIFEIGTEGALDGVPESMFPEIAFERPLNPRRVKGALEGKFCFRAPLKPAAGLRGARRQILPSSAP